MRSVSRLFTVNIGQKVSFTDLLSHILVTLSTWHPCHKLDLAQYKVSRNQYYGPK